MRLRVLRTLCGRGPQGVAQGRKPRQEQAAAGGHKTGPAGFIAGFPLAPGTLSTGLLIIRKPRPVLPGTSTQRGIFAAPMSELPEARKALYARPEDGLEKDFEIRRG